MSRVPSEEFKFGTKGVTIPCEPASQESVEEDERDLGLAHLRRRCTKIAIPIAAKMAPPMVPPTIAPMSRFLRDGGILVPPLAFIVSTGALRDGLSQE